DGHVDDAGVEDLQHRSHRHRDGDDPAVRVRRVQRARRVHHTGGGHGYFVTTVAVTLMPGRSGCAASAAPSTAMRTGMRCTTFVKLPVALSGGSSEKRAPVAGLRLSTWPMNLRPGYASTWISARSPGVTSRISVSFMFATTHTSFSGTTSRSACPACTYWPTSTVLRLTTPSLGATMRVYDTSRSARSRAACAASTRADAPVRAASAASTCFR